MNIYESCESLIASVYTYKPRGTYGPRIHSDLRLVYNYTGSAEVRIDDNWYHFGTGQMVFLLPGTEEEYIYSSDSESRCGWCALLSPQPREVICEKFADIPPVHEFSERFKQLAEMAEALYPASSTSDRAVYDAIIQSMFCEFFRIAGYQEKQEPPLHPAVDAGRSIIEKNYHEALDVSQIAKAAGVSPQHLVRLFKRDLHMSPTTLLWQTRSRHAEQLLLNTGFSASEIAYRCGFANPNHFSRVFKTHYNGVPPAAYRRVAWSGGGTV